jgi:ATP-dependent 26S proteasome regulatory subunit
MPDPQILHTPDGPIPATVDVNGSMAVRYTTNTTAVTGGNFRQIQCLTDTVFSVLTRTNATGSIAGVTLPAGTVLFGPFTAYTLTSGAVAAYN